MNQTQNNHEKSHIFAHVTMSHDQACSRDVSKNKYDKQEVSDGALLKQWEALTPKHRPND